MLKTNLVSVIMPNYNCAAFIGQSIESVIAQTYENWELLITDDASTDNSVEIIKYYQRKDKRIKLFRHSCCKNAAKARNTSLENASGQFVAFLDSDDYWDNNKLEVQVKYMKENNVCFCCHSYRIVDLNGNTKRIKIVSPEKISYETCLRLSNPIGNLTAMYDRSRLGTIYSPNIKCRNDFAMWLQILKMTDYCNGINDILASYRTGVNNSVSKKKLRLIRYHWRLYRRIEKLPFAKCVHYIICWAFHKGLSI